MHKSEFLPQPPQCLFAAELHVKDGQNCFLHSHACTEIVWFKGCAGWLLQGGGRLRYEDGDVGIYQPGSEHGDACETGGVQFCLGVNGGGAERLPPGMWRADPPTLATLERLRGDLGRHDAWRQRRLDLLGGCVVLELARQTTAQADESSQEPHVVRSARKILDTRFGEPLTVAGIAANVGVSPDYLRQAFVKWTGEPPVRYLIRRRLDAACDLLRLNQETTARIAERVGIANPFYFSRLFRSRFACTPTQYRDRYA